MADERPIRELIRDRALLNEAMRRIGEEVRRRHKLLGRPLVVWRDDKVVKIPPEEIQVEDTGNRG